MPFARSLHGFCIAAGDYQLVGGTEMPQTMEHDAGEFRVLILPLDELLADKRQQETSAKHSTLKMQSYTAIIKL